MSQERKPRKQRTTPTKAQEYGLKTISFQAPEEIHTVLENAASTFKLDKAGMARLAVRALILGCYNGNGDWSIPAELEEEIVYASSAAHMARKLPK
jgi:hypothetical protein